jgi:hypothetical protein
VNHETSIVYDHEISQVRVFTDREGVKNGIVRRLGVVHGLTVDGDGPWSLRIPMQFCRGPEMITRLLNEDEKKPMTEAQKEAFRAANVAVSNQATGDHP